MDKNSLKKQLIEWRHYIHQNPEAAFEETNTAQFVAEKLKEMGIAFCNTHFRKLINF